MPEYILTILFALGTFAASLVAYYFYIKTKLSVKTITCINAVETLEISGAAKKEQVVEALYDATPIVLRPLITKSILEELVQRAFDQVKSFALKQ